MNNIQKSFKQKSQLRKMADGGAVRPTPGALGWGMARNAGQALQSQKSRTDAAIEAAENGMPPPAAPAPAPAAPKPTGLRAMLGLADGGSPRWLLGNGVLGAAGDALQNNFRNVDNAVDSAVNGAPTAAPAGIGGRSGIRDGAIPPAAMLAAQRRGLANGGMVDPDGDGDIGADMDGDGDGMQRGNAAQLEKGHGGKVKGPGGPRADQVGPVALSSAEYVLPSDTVQALGGPEQLDKIRDATHDFSSSGKLARGLRGYADGGPIPPKPQYGLKPGSIPNVDLNLGANATPPETYGMPETPSTKGYTVRSYAPRSAPYPSAAGIDVQPATFDDFAKAGGTQNIDVKAPGPSNADIDASIRSGKMPMTADQQAADLRTRINSATGAGPKPAASVTSAGEAAPDVAKMGRLRGLANGTLAKLGAAAVTGQAIHDSMADDSTARYAKRFGVSEPTGDGSIGDMAKFALLRAGGFASDLGNRLTGGLAGEFYQDHPNADPSTAKAATPTSAPAPAASAASASPQTHNMDPVQPGSARSNQLENLGVPVADQNKAPLPDAGRGGALRGQKPGTVVNMGEYGNGSNIYGTANGKGRVNSFAGVGNPNAPRWEDTPDYQAAVGRANKDKADLAHLEGNDLDGRFNKAENALRDAYAGTGEFGQIGLAKRLAALQGVREQAIAAQNTNETERERNAINSDLARSRLRYEMGNSSARLRLDMAKYLDEKNTKAQETGAKWVNDAAESRFGKGTPEAEGFKSYLQSAPAELTGGLMSQRAEDRARAFEDLFARYQQGGSINADQSGLWGTQSSEYDPVKQVRPVHLIDDVVNGGMGVTSALGAKLRGLYGGDDRVAVTDSGRAGAVRPMGHDIRNERTLRDQVAGAKERARLREPNQ